LEQSLLQPGERMQSLRLGAKAWRADRLFRSLYAHTRERAVAAVPVREIAAKCGVVGRGEVELKQSVRHLPARQTRRLCLRLIEGVHQTAKVERLHRTVVQWVLRCRVVRPRRVEDDLQRQQLVSSCVPVLE